MKKNFPLILALAGVFFAIFVAFIVFKKTKSVDVNNNTSEANVPEISESEWPAISLIPSEDPKVPNSLGHFLDFRVEKINIPNAKTMDYELIYSTTNGGQQGVPGTVQLNGNSVERKLLMGSESSGKYRFDDGVKYGTITIRFRDANGKLLGKLSTNFHLQFGETILSSQDGQFKYTLDEPTRGVYFLTMKTFAKPEDTKMVVWHSGYAVFASDGLPHKGNVSQ